MLYVFAGFHKCDLNAGGLQYAIETVEELGALEHHAIQYRREGRYIWGAAGSEWCGEYEYWISPSVVRAGITWQWFPPNWAFGNGVTVAKTTAAYSYDPVGQLIESEGLAEYRARWLPGTCPDRDHIVHLTWITTAHRLPDFALARIQALVEDPAVVLRDGHLYDRALHFSATRPWDGRPALSALRQ